MNSRIRQFVTSRNILFYNFLFPNYEIYLSNLKDVYNLLPILHVPSHAQSLSVNIQHF